jgi:uncharacterized protein (TIGR00661 family)
LKKNRILVAPLDWGLGHATRCIPIIDGLLRRGAEVLIAAEGETYSLLKGEFPDLIFLSLSGYNIKYSSRLPTWLAVLMQIPKVILSIWKEHRWLKRTIRKENISAVISDNRFGLWSREVKSIYITHQVMIKCPKRLKIFEPLLYRIHHFFISKYHECWIPDYPSKEKNLSGDLSHLYPLPANAKFIGPLSRFSSKSEYKHEYDVAAIISGPEPQRTDFEERIKRVLSGTSLKTIIIRGKPSGKNTGSDTDNHPHLSSKNLERVLTASNLVISRAGYSGVMDLVRMKKNAVLIPTSGQTEQEYLANELMKRRIFFSMKQSELDLIKALEESKKYSVENFAGDEQEIQFIEALQGVMDYQQGTRE